MANRHPDKPACLEAVQNGESPRSVADRYHIEWTTFRQWMSRWRKRGQLPVTPGCDTRRACDTPPVTPPDNVVQMKPAASEKPRTKGGKTTDPEVRRQKLEAYHAEQARVRKGRREKALKVVDRATLTKIIRRLVLTQETGLWCPHCDANEITRADKKGLPLFNQLTPNEFFLMTKSLHMNLDKLGELIEFEEKMAETGSKGNGRQARLRRINERLDTTQPDGE